MMKLELIRHAYLPKCVLGWLTVGDLRLATIEDAWRPDPDGPGGQRREADLLESCVQDGLYELEPHEGTKWKQTWALVNPRLGVWHWQVPATVEGFGRSAILIHSGRDDRSSLGCIIVGTAHTILDNRHQVLGSTQGLQQLRDTLRPGTRHQIQIRPRAGTTE